VDAIGALIDEVMEKHAVDAKRVYLTGLSMGGFATWELGLKTPERFAAIAPICGGGNPYPPYGFEPKRAEALKTMGIWAFHGGKDPVVKLAESERMVQAMKLYGCGDVELTVYPEAEHDSWTETYNNPKLYEWLLKHSCSFSISP
jgi:predicted peptidase